MAEIITPAVEGKPKSARKSKPKPSTEGKSKRSLNLSLPQEVYERLAIHAMRMTSGNISDLVSKLANENLRDFHISRTGTKAEGSDPAAPR